MSHDISIINGKAEIAYAGETPWHNLGQRVPACASIEEFAAASNLLWHAVRTRVRYYSDADTLQTWDERVVLLRSDTKKPLAVVSSDYEVFQPSDVLEFFRDLIAREQYQLEVVGALREGKRVWALARAGENAKVLDDEVAPYLLLATSFDGSLATTAQLTTVRIVCNNTLRASLQIGDRYGKVSVPHSTKFHANKVKQRLNLGQDSWETFLATARRLAETPCHLDEARKILQQLFAKPAKLRPNLAQVGKGSIDGSEFSQLLNRPVAALAETPKDPKAVARCLELFDGGQLGTGQDAIKATRWGLLQAVGEFVDHHRGRTPDSTQDSAWFGAGAAVKDEAYKLLTA